MPYSKLVAESILKSSKNDLSKIFPDGKLPSSKYI